MSMAKIKQNPLVNASAKHKVVYEQRSVMLGLIKYWTEVSSKQVSEMLQIDVLGEVDKVFINGDEYIKKL